MGDTVAMMTSRGRGVALCVVALLSLCSMSVQAQGGDPNIPLGWEMGIDYEASGLQDGDPLVLEEDGTTIRFWIKNNYLSNINVDLEYDWSGPQATHDGDESVSVSGGQNETFSVKMTGVDLWAIAAGTTYDFEIDGQLTSVGMVPILTPDSQNAEGEVVVPSLHRWNVEITEIEHPISAGTEFNLHFDLKNVGNMVDSFMDASVEDDCPVLTVDDEPLQSMEGVAAQPGTIHSVTLVFDASSTHPTRICEIEITVKSTGVNNGGLGDSTNKGELEINVKARPVGAQQDQDEANVGDDDGPQNQEQVTSNNFLPTPFLITPVSILLAALYPNRKKGKFRPKTQPFGH